MVYNVDSTAGMTHVFAIYKWQPSKISFWWGLFYSHRFSIFVKSSKYLVHIGYVYLCSLIGIFLLFYLFISKGPAAKTQMGAIIKSDNCYNTGCPLF